MNLQCEHCDRRFPTNTSLYLHKQTQHNPPNLLIMNHDHGNKNISDDGPGDFKTTKIKDSELDDGLEIIDEYQPNIPKKRKRHPKDDSNYGSRKKKMHEQLDDELEVVDEYNDDDINDNLKVDDESDDGEKDENLKIIDEFDDDGQDDPDLKVIDRYDGDPGSNRKFYYKRLYEECIKSHKKQKSRFKKVLQSIQRQNKNDKAKFLAENKKLKKFHEQKMTDLETLKDKLCTDELNKLKQECNEKIADVEKRYNKIINDLEKEFDEKIKRLNDQIKSMEEDDENLSSLAKAIFNCTTMEEIFEIQRLIKNHQLDVVVERHLQTLQNLFFSLSYGVLPICQPQRAKVSDKQKQLVEKIQSSSKHSAKRLIKENKDSITNLFTIIEDSIKLARNSYNRYGTDFRDDN